MGCCAEPVEAPGISLDIGLAHARLARQVAREGAEHGAVPRRLGEKKIGRGNARRRRHVLDDDGRLARYVLGEVAREEASSQIVVVSRLMPDDHSDLFFPVEFLRALRVHPNGRAQEGAQAGAQGENHCCDRRKCVQFHATCRRCAGLFRRALVHQSRGCLIVAFLARQQRRQADEPVIIIERNQMVLARRQ